MKNGKVYSTMFPIWFLLAFPITWLVILPINLIIDTIVLIAGFKYFKVEKAYETYKKVILKVWILGFVANIIGCLALYLTRLLPNADQVSLHSAVTNQIPWNPLTNVWTILITLLAIAISMILLYNFNYKISFKKVGLERKKAKKLAALMAIFTAPWILLFPSNMLFNNNSNSNQALEYSMSNEDKSLEISEALNELELCAYIEDGVFDCNDLKLSVNVNSNVADQTKLQEYKGLFESDNTNELLNKNAEKLFNQISYINDVVFQVSDDKTYTFNRNNMN